MPAEVSQLSDVVRAGAAALATAAATALVVTVNEWFKERGAENRGARQLQLARDQLAVLSSWATLNAQLSPGADLGAFREAIQGDLDAAIEAVRLTHVEAGRGGSRVTLAHVMSVILLTNLRGGTLVKVLRAFYWCGCAVLLVVVPFSVQVSLTDPSTSGLGSVFLAVFVIFVYAIPALSLRWLTKYASRRYERRARPPSSALAGAGGSSA